MIANTMIKALLTALSGAIGALLIAFRKQVVDFIKFLKDRECKIRNIKIQPRYLNDGLRPDAFIEFQYENDVYFILLEIDYTHYTSNMKI